MIQGNILDMKGGQNVIVVLLYLASGEEWSDNQSKYVWYAYK